jgi:hypothetical protein
MDAKELYSQIEDIIGEALRPEIIRHYTVEEARVKCIALISSALSAQAAEVERLKAECEVVCAIYKKYRGNCQELRSHLYAEWFKDHDKALLPPDIQKVKP